MEKINHNGKLISKSDFSISLANRGLRYGDSFFETIKCHLGKPLYWEDHYFRISSSLLITKMNPPNHFSIESFKQFIEELLQKNNLCFQSSRVKITFFRNSSGYYLPDENNTSYIIESESLVSDLYQINKKGLNITFYRDNFISKGPLSNIKSSNRLINVVSSMYARENGCDDVLLINNNNHIVESSKGNIFIVNHSNNIITPPLEDGCINGVVRSVLLREKRYHILEKSITFSDIMNAKEVFISNVITGLCWVAKLGSKSYIKNISIELLSLLNQKCFNLDENQKEL